jgi:CYTH domain
VDCCNKTGCRLLLAAAYFLFLPLAWADEVKGGYNRPLLENQQKYLVPADIADSLWHYIRRSYQSGALKKINPHFSAEATLETYLDEYFDDARYTLLRHQHSLRLRRVFTGKAVGRQFIQVKISPRPRQRNIRQEIKFNLNDRPDKQGGRPDHPFLRLIRAGDRRQADSVLTRLRVKSEDLRPVLSFYQERRRLYLRERGSELAHISLDAVRTEDGQSGFYELELALDEPAYTRANATQRQRLSHVLELLQLDLTNRFPSLRQDQTPKYNKMYNLLHQSRIRPRYYNLAWLGVGLALAGIGLYLLLTRNRPAPQPRELL